MPVSGTAGPPLSSKDASKDAGKEEEPWQLVQKHSNRVLTESELRNGLASLRTQGRLHRAAVSDQYRFGADLSVGGSMVLSGAGASPTPPGVWASYASHLNIFHNKAMRTVNPSQLELLPEVKKKPRKKKADDEDDLQLSKSGLFFSRYKPDAAYRTIRRIRRDTFPESEEEKAEGEHHARQLVALGFRSDMAGGMLF